MKKVVRLSESNLVRLIKRVIKEEVSSNDLYNIMNNGADEFKKKTGRNMTYSEIRHLYG